MAKTRYLEVHVVQITPVQTSPGAATSTIPAESNPSELGKEDFLKLLVTQLEYQDPMNPVSNEEFIAQTAQFSSLEQMQNLNTSMTELMALERSSGNAALVSYIGETVEVPGTSVELGRSPAVMGVGLPDSAYLTLEVRDSQDVLVRTIETEGLLSPDDYRFVWDGTDDSGEPLPQGMYHFTPIAANAEGDPVTTNPFILGQVSGVLYESNTAQLRVNDELVNPDAVRAVISD